MNNHCPAYLLLCFSTFHLQISKCFLFSSSGPFMICLFYRQMCQMSDFLLMAGRASRRSPSWYTRVEEVKCISFEMQIHLTIVLNGTFLLWLCSHIVNAFLCNKQKEELAVCSLTQLETFAGDHWIGLFFSLKCCVTNSGLQKLFWDAGEPSESVFTMVFACLFSREHFLALDVQTSACIVL